MPDCQVPHPLSKWSVVQNLCPARSNTGKCFTVPSANRGTDMPWIRKIRRLLLAIMIASGMLLYLCFLDFGQQNGRADFIGNNLAGHGRLTNTKPSVAIDAAHHRPQLTSATKNNTPAKRTEKNATKSFCAGNENLSDQEKLTTVDVFGRLGNNMFQYAGLLGVAKMNNRTPFVQTKSPLAQYFKITHVKPVPNANKWKLIGEPNYGIYNPHYECLPRGPLMMQCFFQSFKYFQEISQTIRDEFVFVPSVQQAADNILKQFKSDPHNNGNRTVIRVGVHIRRGDKLRELKSGERVAPVSYFEKAFDWMRNKYKDVVFLVASDDTRWTKANVIKRPDVKLLPNAPGQVHLSVLTKCDHVIMSVGTFGWWAGWLAGGDVIYFTDALVPGSWKGERMKTEDYFPPRWVGLGS